MKFKVGDEVRVTAGKDKGKTGKILKVDPQSQRVLVEGVNKYTKHIKPMMGRSGDKIVVERFLPTANVAILNDKGEADRIGYKKAKDGSKVRIYKKTGKAIPENTNKEEKK